MSEARIKIDEVAALLASYILVWPPSERQGLPKMGGKTIGFVEKDHDFAQKNPNLAPHIDGTEMVAGSEAYQAALVFYKSVKMVAAQDNVPGAKAVYDKLKTRFPGGKRKPGETEPETVTETVKKEVKVL